ncbi:unnamed protein product [Cuscuta europaea]|uniref:Uncharacterized protein n=1 Tax=Cuscuta europaea TaxID=41803 RepID=A0A9P0YNV9_CUSEU|nr:unnamed protein product [Cuscuta europaea]
MTGAEDSSAGSSSSDDDSDDTKSGDELASMAAGPPGDVPRYKIDLRLIREWRQKLTSHNRAQIPDPMNFRLRAGLHPMRHVPRMVVVHLDSVKAGLRFPLHPFFVSFLNFYEIVPA